jgi:hypothetical protein
LQISSYVLDSWFTSSFTSKTAPLTPSSTFAYMNPKLFDILLPPLVVKGSSASLVGFDTNLGITSFIPSVKIFG